MREHPSAHQLQLYQRRALAPHLFLEVHGHLDACPDCSRQCNAPARLKEDYATLLDALMPEPGDEAYHLTEEEIDGYVSQSLSRLEQESAESHLEVCRECARALKELRAAAAQNSLFQASQNTNVAPLSGQRAMHPIFASLTARRSVQFASLTLAAIGLLLLTLFLMRQGDARRDPAQLPTNQDLSATHNTERTDAPGNKTNQTRPSSNESLSDKDEGKIPPRGENDSESRQPPDSLTSSRGGGDRRTSPAPADEAAWIETLSPSARRAIKAALTNGTLERPEILERLNGARGRLLGESGDGLPFHLLSPLGKVVQSTNPTFRWEALKGASSYVVTVTDDHLNEVVSSGPLTKTEWTTATTLKRGVIYSWQVTAFKDGQSVISPALPAPQAMFAVLDQSSQLELERTRQTAPRNHLIAGIVLARAGLLADAEREFQLQLSVTPNAGAAQKLLRRVQAMQRQ